MSDSKKKKKHNFDPANNVSSTPALFLFGVIGMAEPTQPLKGEGGVHLGHFANPSQGKSSKPLFGNFEVILAKQREPLNLQKLLPPTCLVYFWNP